MTGCYCVEIPGDHIPFPELHCDKIPNYWLQSRSTASRNKFRLSLVVCWTLKSQFPVSRRDPLVCKFQLSLAGDWELSRHSEEWGHDRWFNSNPFSLSVSHNSPPAPGWQSEMIEIILKSFVRPRPLGPGQCVVVQIDLMLLYSKTKMINNICQHFPWLTCRMHCSQWRPSGSLAYIVTGPDNSSDTNNSFSPFLPVCSKVLIFSFPSPLSNWSISLYL